MMEESKKVVQKLSIVIDVKDKVECTVKRL